MNLSPMTAPRSPTPSAAATPTAAPAPPYGAILVALIVVVALVRLALREALGYGLHYDEAQYFAWSLEPAWGYFSKPPMVAWAIGAARLACGDGAFCVRLPSALALAGATGFVYLTGCRLFSTRTGFWAALLFLLAPLVAFLNWFITTDSLLLLAWSAALYGMVRALQSPTTRAALPWWLFTGFVAGLGLLSKYTMGIFALSAAGALLTVPALRPHLRSAGPWLGAAVAALLFAPNLAWNAAHRFATFGHTAEISNLDDARFSLLRGAEFLGAQVGIFGPVTMLAFVLGVVALARPARAAAPARPAWAPALLVWFALPFLLVITTQALAARAHANWAAPTYVAAALLAAAWLSARPTRRWLAAAVVVDVLIMAVASGAGPLVKALDLRLPQDPTAQVKGWEDLGRAVQRRLDEAPPGTRLLVDERRLISLMIYYAGPRARDALIWNPEGRVTNHYQLLRDVAQAPSGPFLMISHTDRSAELQRAFVAVTPLGQIGAPAAPPADPPGRRVFAWQLGALRAPAPRRPRRGRRS